MVFVGNDYLISIKYIYILIPLGRVYTYHIFMEEYN